MIAAQLGLLYLCIRFRPVGRWSKSISSDGARVVFDAPEEEEGRREGEERDLMDLSTEEREEEREEEEGGYADKQPLLVTLGAMFRGSGSTYGRVSGNDPSSYNSGSLPQPTTSTPPTASRLSSVLSHLKPPNSRPLNFWQWSDYNSYLIFLSLYILLLLILYLILSSSSTFISLLGYLALGLESTLPIPQLIANYRRKSLAGFRASVLVGWLGGDSFKLLYFLLRGSPVQFTSCAVFQLSIDLAILGQSRLYRENTVREEEERRLQEGGAEGRGRGREGEIEGDVSEEGGQVQGSRGNGRVSKGSGGAKGGKGKGKGKGRSTGGSSSRGEQDELLSDPHHVISIEADEDDDEGDISNGRK